MSKERKPRRIVTRSGFGHRGRFASAKMQGAVEFESMLEHDACLLMEFSTGIVEYRSQPEVVAISDTGDLRRYTPDYEVVFSDGCSELWEIKPHKKLEDAVVRERLDRVAEHLASHGRDLRVVTCKEIRRQPLLANLRLLARYRSPCINPVPGELRKRIPTLPTPLGDLARAIGALQTYQLLADQHLFFNYSEPLEQTTVISTRGGTDASVLL